MAVASKQVATGQKVWPTWLILTYLLHTLGELCVSPVGLSSVSKLAPRRLVGQMMGLWFLATSLGNLVAGLIAGGFSPQATGDMGGRFFQIGQGIYIFNDAFNILIRIIIEKRYFGLG